MAAAAAVEAPRRQFRWWPGRGGAGGSTGSGSGGGAGTGRSTGSGGKKGKSTPPPKDPLTTDPSKDPTSRAYFHPEILRKKQEEIIAMGWKKRPDPSTYLSKDFIQRHLEPFRHGIVRVTTKQNIKKHKSAGGDDAFALSFEGLVEVLVRTGGDHHKTEKVLALDKGALASGDAVVAVVSAHNAPGVRVPSGNEQGANSDWMAGGYTKLGIPEAVVNLRKKPFTIVKLDVVMKWVESKKISTPNFALSNKDVEDLKKWMMTSK